MAKMTIRPVRVTFNQKSRAYRLGYRLGGCLMDGLIFWLVVYLIARFFFDF